MKGRCTRKKSDMKDKRQRKSLAFIYRSPEELLDLALKMLTFIAQCDRDNVEVPDQFLLAFGRLRDALRQKCVSPEYSEENFREFFVHGVLGFVVKEYGLTQERVAAFQGSVCHGERRTLKERGELQEGVEEWPPLATEVLQ